VDDVDDGVFVDAGALQALHQAQVVGA